MIRSLAAASVAFALTAAAQTVEAQALRVVHVRAPDINCVFSHDCRLLVRDSVGTVALDGTSGTARIQSRTADAGALNTPGFGLTPYVYRVNLNNVSGRGTESCVRRFQIDFGTVEARDYDGDGIRDHVWVTTVGGLGDVAPVAAYRNGTKVTFEFEPSVCAGETSYFFGMASRRLPVASIGRIVSDASTVYEVDVRTPEPLPIRFLRGDVNVSGATDMADAVALLSGLFRTGADFACDDATDVNDDGRQDVADAVRLLGYLFRGESAPPSPFFRCGFDSTPDELGCASFDACAADQCTDPSADSIRFSIRRRSSQFRGLVRITGRVVNNGGDFTSSSGQQSVVLYEVPLGGRGRVVARRDFTNLLSGQSIEVSYQRDWDASSPAEGEFPPTYRVALSYDPDIYIDGNEGNDDCVSANNSLDVSGMGINELFR